VNLKQDKCQGGSHDGKEDKWIPMYIYSSNIMTGFPAFK
jgi:hypothetical protein